MLLVKVFYNFIQLFILNNNSFMKVLIDIRKKDKVPFVMEFLGSQSYIKTKTFSDEGAALMQDLKEAMNEVKLHNQGKIKLKTAQQLLNEL